jgi:hypothetical protein
VFDGGEIAYKANTHTINNLVADPHRTWSVNFEGCNETNTL